MDAVQQPQANMADKEMPTTSMRSSLLPGGYDTCDSCGNHLMPDAKFCRACGTARRVAPSPVAETCTSCGNIFMADSVFCRVCGVKRASEAKGTVKFSEDPEIIRTHYSNLRESNASLDGRNSGPTHSHSFVSYLVSSLLPTTEQAQELSEDEDTLSRQTSLNASSTTWSGSDATRLHIPRELRTSGRDHNGNTVDLRDSSSNIHRQLTPRRNSISWVKQVLVRTFSNDKIPNSPRSSNASGRTTSTVAHSVRRSSWTRTGHQHTEDLPALCSTKQFRIIDRDAPFGQSEGIWAINNVRCVAKPNKRRLSTNTFRQLGKSGIEAYEEYSRMQEKKVSEQAARAAQELNHLHGRDFYHLFLDSPLGGQLGLFAATYMLCFFGFAGIYLFIAEDCALDLKGDFIRAYLLSLETMTTIGYGVPDPYMNGCKAGPVVLTMQSFIQLLLAALLIGIIFQRLSQPQSRAHTILFSEKAVIQQIDGVLYFMFRVCDLRIRHALIEPHVRCYCLWKHAQRGYEMVPLRLDHPDDELGAPLLMTLPAMVVHRIDAWSPLAPCSAGRPVPHSRQRSPHGSPKHSKGKHISHEREEHPLRFSSWPGPAQRQVDCESGNRNSCICPTCGSTFGTETMLELHCRYNAVADRKNGIPLEACHKEFGEEHVSEHTHQDPDRCDVEEYLCNTNIEVVVLIEGVEPTTSSTLQARHSYMVGAKTADVEDDAVDVEWDMEFVECCKVPKDESKGLVIDLTKFHELREVDET